MTVERLSALDECFLRLESDAAHMDVGWTLLVEGERPSLDQLRAHVAARLELLPRFRQRVVSSRLGLHDPVWADDQRFDLAHHVRSAAVEAPGAAGLRTLAGRLLSVPLDRERPLWRLHLVEGLGERRFALVGQAHHALVDGVAAVEMAQLLLDGHVNSTVASPCRAFQPRPAPVLRDRITATVDQRTRLARSAGALAARALANPGLLREGVAELRRLGSAVSAVGAQAPRTSLNRAIGPERSVGFAELPLGIVKELGYRSGATVNDVVLAATSLALGRHLRRLGESHPWLRVLVPVSTRPDRAGAELGNQLSVMFIELPIGERDPCATLAEVARQTREHKRAAHARSIEQLLRASGAAPAQLRDAVAWLITRPQTFNAVVSNVPGPQEPLYLLGRRVRAAYPAVPLVQGHGLSIAVLSYSGTLHVGLCADPGVVGELVDLARAFTASLGAMRLALLPQRQPRPRRPDGRRARRADRPVLA